MSGNLSHLAYFWYPIGGKPLGPGGTIGLVPGGGIDGPWNLGGSMARGNPGGGI